MAPHPFQFSQNALLNVSRIKRLKIRIFIDEKTNHVQQ